jgi:hypothetical protein
MKQVDLERDLKIRICQWASEAIEREVRSDFPVLSQCQHERRIKCFLEWMKGMDDDQRLPICLSLAKQAKQKIVEGKYEMTSFDEDVEEAYGRACCHYHGSLPPTPNSDRSAPGFVKADLARAREMIAELLAPDFGPPTKRPKRSLWYIRHHGDWFLKTVVELRSPWGAGRVECYHFIWRSDFKYGTKTDELYPRVDPVWLMGVSMSQFPLLSISQEQLSAKAVLAVMEMFVPAFPSLVADLD